MTITAPVTLQKIQNEFGVSSLSAAGLAYFGRANCNMLEFLGASSTTYNFGNYTANTQGPSYYDSAYVNFNSNGTVTVYYDGYGPNQGPPYGLQTYNWLVSGSGAGVEAYVTRYVTPTSGFTGGGEPTLNTWIPIGNATFGVAGYGGSNEYGSWNISFRNAQGVSIGSSSVAVTLYISNPEQFGTSYYFSDIRLKENIQKIGQINGLNIYSYNYLNSKISYTGVMAQELIGTKYESAVRTHPSGFYQVDYSKIPVTRNSF
jgi:hypothetical protein